MSTYHRILVSNPIRGAIENLIQQNENTAAESPLALIIGTKLAQQAKNQIRRRAISARRQHVLRSFIRQTMNSMRTSPTRLRKD